MSSLHEWETSPRAARAKQAYKGIAMDLAMAALGAITIWFVTQRLSFEDSRPLLNAWTYVLGIPAVLVGIDLLLRTVVSQFVERSLQIAFLLSTLVHLLLTISGFHLIVFANGPVDDQLALAADLAQQEQLSSSIPEFVQTIEEPDTPRADYLRPAATSDTEASQLDPTKQAIELPATVPSPADEPDVMAETPEAKLERQVDEPDFRDLEIESQAMELERPAAGPSELAANDAPIEVPENEAPTSAVPVEQLSAREIEVASRESKMEIASPLFDLPTQDLTPSPLKNRSQPRKKSAIQDMSLDLLAVEPSLGNVASSARRTVGPSSVSASDVVVELPRGSGVAGASSSIAPSDAPIASSNGSIGRKSTASRLQGSADALKGLDAGLSNLTPSVDKDRAPSRSLAMSGGRKGGLPDLDISFDLPGLSGVRQLPKLPSARPTPAAPAVPIPAPAFQQRIARNDGSANAADLGEYGPETEAAIERGLEFLAKTQRPDGSWRLEDFGEETRLRSHTAATGLALLSFQGAGYSHRQYHYAPVCKAALEYLLANQKTDGDLYQSMDPASDANLRFYSHSIAALALCEAFGMTQDEALREPAQRAVQFMVESQDPKGGGWRYQPRLESDTSVSGWFMMALRSAELAGLSVPRSTFEGIQRWLDKAQVSPTERHLYRYNPLAADTPETRHGRVPNPTMTSVGLLMRLYLGWRRDNPEMIRGAAYLLSVPPREGSLDNPQRDTYYWYYATQVLFHMGGDTWRQWNNQLHPLLIRSQLLEGDAAGSWDPASPVPDRWGPFAGRLYVTTLNLLSLEVYYRHLPIYEDTAR